MDYLSTMADDEDEAEWLPAWEAVQLVARRFGGLSRAQEALAHALREQILDAGAEKSAICEADDDEFTELEATEDTIIEVPREVWSRSDHWESDRLRWDWETGDFEVNSDEDGSSYLFFGVNFLASEIAALDPSDSIFRAIVSRTGVSPEAEAVKGTRGRKPAHKKWSALIASVLELEREGQLTTQRFSSPSELREQLQLQIEDENLHFEDRTIDPVVGYIFENLLCGSRKPI